MHVELIKALHKKEVKTEVEWELLKCYKMMMLLEEIVIQESKCHVTSKDAMEEIRKLLQENLG